jgi:hypothetical protein
MRIYNQIFFLVSLSIWVNNKYLLIINKYLLLLRCKAKLS